MMLAIDRKVYILYIHTDTYAYAYVIVHNLYMIVIFYKVSTNIEPENTKLLFLGKYRVRFL